MSDYIDFTIKLDPAIHEMLGRIAEDVGSTREALAIEAVNNMVAFIVSGGKEGVDEMQIENQIEAQLSFVQDTMDEFEG